MGGIQLWCLGVLWIAGLSLATDLTCSMNADKNAEISVTFSSSDVPAGTNKVQSPCGSETKDLVIGTAVSFVLDCITNFDIETSFEVITFKRVSEISTDTLLWTAQCYLGDYVGVPTISSSVTITGASAGITGPLVAELSADIGSSYIVGSKITITITLDQKYRSFAVIGVESMYVNNVQIVIDGYSTLDYADELHISIHDQGTTAVTVEWDAYLTDGFAATGQSMNVEGIVKICPPGTTDCYFYYEDPCLDFPEEFGKGEEMCKRKRREANDQQNERIKVEAKTMILLNAAQKEQYDQQLARTHQSAESSQLCMNKTVSVVVVVILIIGVIVCLLTTIWMFFKMRTARRRTSSRTSNLNYSNKSFKI